MENTTRRSWVRFQIFRGVWKIFHGVWKPNSKSHLSAEGCLWLTPRQSCSKSLVLCLYSVHPFLKVNWPQRYNLVGRRNKWCLGKSEISNFSMVFEPNTTSNFMVFEPNTTSNFFCGVWLKHHGFWVEFGLNSERSWSVSKGWSNYEAGRSKRYFQIFNWDQKLTRAH